MAAPTAAAASEAPTGRFHRLGRIADTAVSRCPASSSRASRSSTIFTSSALCQRRLGSFSRQSATTIRNSPGISDGSGGGSVRSTEAIAAAGVSPRNARRPPSISYSIDRGAVGMSLPGYQSYKESGLAWLGKVPGHWDVTPLKHVASLKGRLGWQGLRADEYTEDGPFLVTSEHFANEAIDWTRCYHVTPERYAQAPEIQLRADDVLLMKDGAAMGKLAYVHFIPGPACLNSHLLLFRPLNGRFAN